MEPPTPLSPVFGPYITREMALSLQLKQYFDGLPCKKGHISQRQTINRRCLECVRQKKQEKGIGVAVMKLCSVCKAEFATQTSSKLFCTIECKKSWEREKAKFKRRGPVRRECRWCNDAFITEHSTQSFCCAEHSRLWHHEQVRIDPEKKARSKSSSLRYRKENIDKLRQAYKDYDARHLEERRLKAKLRRSSEEGRKRGNEIARISRQRFKEKHGITPAASHQRKSLNYRISVRLRKRIWEAVSKQNSGRATSFEELCGCSINELIEHLESLWMEGMSWSNYAHDGWHIDHIRPCRSFNLKIADQQRVCFNCRNLSPLWGSENSVKSANYNQDTESAWIRLMNDLGFEGDLFCAFD
jgi:hypothetical protein